MRRETRYARKLQPSESDLRFPIIILCDNSRIFVSLFRFCLIRIFTVLNIVKLDIAKECKWKYRSAPIIEILKHTTNIQQRIIR